ncbi:hypothetical protein MRX96_004459 [Rhipicephalus microplus]
MMSGSRTRDPLQNVFSAVTSPHAAFRQQSCYSFKLYLSAVTSPQPSDSKAVTPKRRDITAAFRQRSSYSLKLYLSLAGVRPASCDAGERANILRCKLARI